jgi:hypothetical protein
MASGGSNARPPRPRLDDAAFRALPLTDQLLATQDDLIKLQARRIAQLEASIKIRDQIIAKQDELVASLQRAAEETGALVRWLRTRHPYVWRLFTH